MQICIELRLLSRPTCRTDTSLFCQVDGIIPYSALGRTAGDEEDAVAFGGGVGTADDVVKVFFGAHGAVVDLEDDEVLGNTGTLQFARLE